MVTQKRLIALLVMGICLGGAVFLFTESRSFSYDAAPTDIRAEEERWSKEIRVQGGQEAYTAFAAAVERLSPQDQHFVSHIFGGVLYEEEGLPGLSVCDTRFFYGCFHEFLSRALFDQGFAILPELEELCVSSPRADAPLSCAHGLGHGLIAYFGYTHSGLRDALAACRTLSHDPFSACPGGVFMEYNLRYFVAADGSAVRPFEGDDLYSPCPEYTGIEASRCVALLPLWWRDAVFARHIDTNIFIGMGKACRELPMHLQAYRDMCFRGVGFVAGAAYVPDIDQLEGFCRAASDELSDVRECLMYVARLLKQGLHSDRGMEMCAGLPEEDRLKCEDLALHVPLI